MIKKIAAWGVVVLGSAYLTHEVYDMGARAGATFILQKDFEWDKETRFMMQKMMKACDGKIIDLHTDSIYGRDICESDKTHPKFYLRNTPWGYVMPDMTVDPVSADWHKKYDGEKK